MHLKRYRTDAGLTQRELAAQVGVSWQAISLLERQQRQPLHATAVAIGSALGVDPTVIWPAPHPVSTSSTEKHHADQSRHRPAPRRRRGR